MKYMNRLFTNERYVKGDGAEAKVAVNYFPTEVVRDAKL
jgi:hypothetical protein